MLGLSFQGQDCWTWPLRSSASARLKTIPQGSALHLALDFERKRMFNKAAAVYEHILTVGDYKDIKERIATMKVAGETRSLAAADGVKAPSLPVPAG